MAHQETIDLNPPTPPDQRQISLEIDDSQAKAFYTNFCKVSSSAEELILDLALNQAPLGSSPSGKVRIEQRIVMSPYTAKRLAQLLTSSIQRHEQALGPIETDIGKRLQQNARG